MRIFETYHEMQTAFAQHAGTAGAYRGSMGYGPAFFRCDHCGKAEILPHSIKPYSDAGCSGGYALTRDNRMHCYGCCHVQDVAEMKDRTKPFYCYLSGDGATVSNWPGGELGRVHSLGSSRAGWHGSRIYRFHVRDMHGGWWQGRGAGKGMCCTLRAMKAPDYAKHWGK